MATVLFTWELGGGLGHLVALRPLAAGLAAMGHRVVVALRDLSRAGQVFLGSQVRLCQAPFKHYPSLREEIKRPSTFADILHNIGFGNGNELAGLVRAWHLLFDLIKPDLVVLDHSPTALLALRGLPCRRVTTGVGFFCPVDESPLPNLCPWRVFKSRECLSRELRVLGTINEVLVANQRAPLQRVAQLFAEVDDVILATFAELDHFSHRKSGTYWGVWPYGLGDPPSWPSTSGLRVFAYLKPFAGLASLLEDLCKHDVSVLVAGDGLKPEHLGQARSQSMRICSHPCEMQQSAATCDVMILNGTHGSATAALLAGKPILQIPITLEQAVFAQRTVDLGAAALSSPTSPKEISAGLTQVLTDPRLGERARAFADKYRLFRAADSVTAIVQRLDRLAGA